MSYIVGFSMRPDDYHTQAIIYPQLVDGSRKGSIRVKVVDHAPTLETQQTIRDRFADIPNCEFWFDGFSEDSLNFLSP